MKQKTPKFKPLPQAWLMKILVVIFNVYLYLFTFINV